ncbi:unnamed protein product [Prorocentrum cordatum]|uniref:Nuclear pore complex protein Nup85 n=1 Tax=Prorocentrum cordatum TaxID=2364126 RepID=A0ABN9SNA2_9DINO|nr:unnamed protein product [Polarella glacialis]
MVSKFKAFVDTTLPNDIQYQPAMKELADLVYNDIDQLPNTGKCSTNLLKAIQVSLFSILKLGWWSAMSTLVDCVRLGFETPSESKNVFRDRTMLEQCLSLRPKYVVRLLERANTLLGLSTVKCTGWPDVFLTLWKSASADVVAGICACYCHCHGDTQRFEFWIILSRRRHADANDATNNWSGGHFLCSLASAEGFDLDKAMVKEELALVEQQDLAVDTTTGPKDDAPLSELYALRDPAAFFSQGGV